MYRRTFTRTEKLEIIKRFLASNLGSKDFISLYGDGLTYQQFYSSMHQICYSIAKWWERENGSDDIADNLNPSIPKIMKYRDDWMRVVLLYEKRFYKDEGSSSLMQSDLDFKISKSMAIDMLKGVEPSFDKIKKFEDLRLGYYNDIYGWRWKSNLEEIFIDKTIKEILEYYTICKNS